MTLLLWKAPVVNDSKEAEALLKPWYDHGDDSAFESTADLATVARELVRRFPDADDGPWGDAPPEESERILYINIRWGADDAVIEAITELSRQYELVLFDPQGPDVHLPSDPVDIEPTPPSSLGDHLKFALIGLAGGGVFWLGWRSDIPVLNWLLMLIGGLVFASIAFVIGAAALMGDETKQGKKGD